MPEPATTIPRRMTLEEFLAVPESEPGHWQLVDGEVVVNVPNAAHQEVVAELLVLLKLWTRDGRGRGRVSLEVDTAAGPTSMLAPDLQWWAEGRATNDKFSRPQPLGDLVIEVRSPSTWAVDVGKKRDIYEREGVRELWLVDPYAQTVLVFSRSTPQSPDFDLARDLAAEQALTSPLLPEFSVLVGELFRELG